MFRNIVDPLFLTDAYKLDHRRQYPPGTTRVYSNLTHRASRIPGVGQVVHFGLQAFIQDVLTDAFGRFFAADVEQVCAEYERRVTAVVGPNVIGSEHIRALHALGYLPLSIRSLPEGTAVPIKVPVLTVENTHPDFFWLTNYIETALSAAVWQPSTSATTAWRLRRLLEERARATGAPSAAVDFQGHDFSFRGMPGLEAAAASGAAHLLSFTGSDSLVSEDWIRYFYPDDSGEPILASVAATEHSVMCAGTRESEDDTYRRLLELYPNGIVSVVSDTFDLWRVLTETLPALRERIMGRDGTLVIRPDSGDPETILCGTGIDDSPAGRGVVRLLWETFGGTVNEAGYRVLDPHVGVIYGDSITHDRADAITARLASLGFVSTTVVFGVGSYTYQYVTRDTFSSAVKATYVEIDGRGRDIFKDPVTDSGTKRSARGRLAVLRDDAGELYVQQQATPEQEAASELAEVWRDGEFLRREGFAAIRARLRAQPRSAATELARNYTGLPVAELGRIPAER
ncbi:nicotinate phosphoribosyltransferase [Nocardia huaxiensis]|uniref:nicotinate phosphoribosyltransferase n=1 Tax=Nocardia huaxiensis TaxID=2755382 RepID=UPI001E36ECA3|nr:nicotinate phosphoribosyltransferase [Nocardia huaxiensis]UFS95894.1 nicotinate phosphoribosyltransferase [Nocardia huaxiensis]